MYADARASMSGWRIDRCPMHKVHPLHSTTAIDRGVRGRAVLDDQTSLST